MDGIDFYPFSADGLDKGKGRQTPTNGVVRFYAWLSWKASLIPSFMKV
jgi:hypothetical protein